jgi:hypothetical protein
VQERGDLVGGVLPSAWGDHGYQLPFIPWPQRSTSGLPQLLTCFAQEEV